MPKKRSKKSSSTRIVRKPKACPWSGSQCQTALTHPEVWFRDIEIEDVQDQKGWDTCLILTSPKKSPDHPGVRLPSRPAWSLAAARSRLARMQLLDRARISHDDRREAASSRARARRCGAIDRGPDKGRPRMGRPTWGAAS